MMELTLEMRFSTRRQRATHAWLVPGRDAAAWLLELTGWHVALQDLTLRVLPRSIHDGRPLGVLVTARQGAQPRASSYCQEYGRVADRFYLPVNAVVDPPLTEAEVAALMAGSDDDYIYHPTAGLVRADASQRLPVAGLLQSPVFAETDWGWAQPGPAICQRLVSITPEAAPSVESILSSGRDDIGTKSLDSKTKGGAAGDADDTSAAAGSGLVGKIAGALGALFGRGSDRDKRKQQHVPPVPKKSHDDELNRLLMLLAQNPDEGLRYAVPLAEDVGSHRGRAGSDAAELSRRNVDFDLRLLSASGPSAAWHVSAAGYVSLRTKYWELANREIALGRYRRAAFIYAHLLNDLNSAAATLMAGRHWREAAVLYRERLGRMADAAACLEKGHLWAEAIALYEQLRQFEKVGDLYMSIGQETEACEAYERSVVQHRDSGDYLQAARVAHTKLHAPQQALAHLRAGWPGSSQARECLSETFRLLAGTGEHAGAVKLVGAIASETLTPTNAAKAVNVLAETAKTYPDPTVRASAGDALRVTLGKALLTADQAESNKMLQELAQLVPRDRLLKRDCLRYEEQCRAHFQRRSPKVSRADGLPLIWSFQLPPGIAWTTATVSGAAHYFAGHDDDGLTLVRTPAGNTLDAAGLAVCYEDNLTIVRTASQGPVAGRQTVRWPLPAALRGSHVLVCPLGCRPTQLLVHLLGASKSIDPASFPPTDENPRGVRIASHPAISARTCGVACSPDDLLWFVEAGQGACTVRTATPGGRILSAHELPLPAELAPRLIGGLEPIAIAAGPTVVLFGIEDYLFALRRGIGLQVFQMASRIRDIQLPPDDDANCALVVCEREVVVRWQDVSDERIEVLCDAASDPVAGFSGFGDVVLVNGSRCEMYLRVRRHHELRTTCSIAATPALAVLAMPRGYQVIVCGKRGDVHLLSLR